MLEDENRQVLKRSMAKMFEDVNSDEELLAFMMDMLIDKHEPDKDIVGTIIMSVVVATVTARLISDDKDWKHIQTKAFDVLGMAAEHAGDKSLMSLLNMATEGGIN